jgi:hypothetical protein
VKYAIAAARPRPILALGNISVAAPCDDTASYPDVEAGTQVVVKNSAGAVIATASLGAGHAQDAITPGVCRFPFDVKVPGGLPRYGIEIGRRGTVWYSAAEMRNGPKLTLG